MRRTLSKSGRFCAYLRKSRDDRDAYGKPMTQEETLRRHRAWLEELADEHGLTVGEWYEEVVSGETILERPEMQRLLDDLDDGKWDGVLVVEVSRLGRPNTKEQGIICEYLEDAEVFVVTLEGVYDTTVEADMDYIEYGFQKARNDWKAINKTQKRGRIRSAKEGNYPFSRPPHGYDKVRVDGKPTIVPNAVAPFVVMAFEWVASGKSFGEVARELTRLHVPCDGIEWSYGVVGKMIRNEKYKGVSVLNRYKPVKRKRDGRKVRNVANPEKAWVRVKGNWEPLVSEELWESANIAGSRPPAVKKSVKVRNPLAGLLYCPKCGHAMRLVKDDKRVYGNPYRFMHATSAVCTVKSCNHDILMDALASELKSRIADMSVEVGGCDLRERESQEMRLTAMRESLAVVDRSLASLLRRLNHEVISEDEYRVSKAELTAERDDLMESIDALEAEMSRVIDFEVRNVTIHQAIDIMRSKATAEEVNRFLRTFIRRIEYENHGVGHNVHDIRLHIDFI